ncbi:MAG: pucR 2 [Anaerosporomusa subterranea]|nr:pucR 2 [Anaerosporomusa subterranea]
MSLTVRDVIQLFQGHSLRLAAGSNGIDNVVSSVNIMDAPDIGRWSKPGDLILTTAFTVKDDVSLQETLIKELAAAGCAGLGIKTKRFVPEVPAVMCQMADEYRLPILELPFNMSLAEIMNSIMISITTRQSYRLQRSNEIHKALTDVAIGSGGLHAIIECLGKLIQCPIGCYDTNRNVLISWLPENMPGLDPTLQTYIKSYLNGNQNHRDELQKQLAMTKTPFTQPVRVENIELLLTSFPIMSSNEFFGDISVLQASDAFLDINCLALEHACTVAALDFLKQKAVMESRRLHSRDMLELLLFADLADQNSRDIISSSVLGKAKVFRCSIIEMDGRPENLNLPVVSTRLYKLTQQAATSRYPLSLVSERAGKIIVLLA